MNDDYIYQPENSLISQMRLSMAMKQRKIFFYDTVNESSVMETMYYLNRLMEVDETLGQKKPIEILINSNGGCCEDGLTLISLIESMIENGYHIITTNIGRAYSMGFMLAISGTERRAYRHARYMVHDVSTCTCGKAQQMREDLVETEVIREEIYDLICSHTSIPREDLISWQERKIDKYFSAKEAVDLGIADKIV